MKNDPFDDPDYRTYSWRLMASAAGKHDDPPPRPDTIGRMPMPGRARARPPARRGESGRATNSRETTSFNR